MMTYVDKVEAVNIFPIKSAHAATVAGALTDSLTVGPTGFEAYDVRDREYVLYDPAEGVMVTQRGWDNSGRKMKFPGDSRLASVQVDIQPEYLEIEIPGQGIVELDTFSEEGRQCDISIFGKNLPVREQNKGVSDCFSRFLQREVVLFRADRTRPRLLPAEYCREDLSNQVAGADGFPFLLTSRASLAHQQRINGATQEAAQINAYRGNIEVGGYALGTFAEDYIRRLRIGAMTAEIVKACLRCPIPNIDQNTGERAGSGLKILRGRACTLPNGQAGVAFGQNMNHKFEEGTVVAIGDSVEALTVDDEPNLVLR